MENHILKKFNENTISTSKIFGFLLYIIVDPERVIVVVFPAGSGRVQSFTTIRASHLLILARLEILTESLALAE